MGGNVIIQDLTLAIYYQRKNGCGKRRIITGMEENPNVDPFGGKNLKFP